VYIHAVGTPEVAPIMRGLVTPEGAADDMGRETYSLGATRSGFASDCLGFTRQFVQQLCDNTNLMIQDQGSKPVVRAGHGMMCDEDGIEGQRANGFITECWTEEAKDAAGAETGDLILFARTVLWGDLLEEFKAGNYLGRSIGAPAMATTKRGELVGPWVAHLALLGKDNPAYADLDQPTERSLTALGKPDRSLLQRGIDTLKILIRKVDAMANKPGTKRAMDPKGNREDPTELAADDQEEADEAAMGKALIAMGKQIQMIGEKLAERAPAGDGEQVPATEAEAEDMGSESTYAKKAAAQNSIMLRELADRSFAGLVDDGHAHADQRGQFDKLVRAEGNDLKGVKAAESFFRQVHAATPPLGELPGGSRPEASMTEREQLAAAARSELKINWTDFPAAKEMN
jgi:hypothetical protein